MIIGGRGAVYFNDTQKDTDIDYYFPKNFTEKLTKLISKGRTDEIRNMLREIYDKNWNMAAPPKCIMHSWTNFTCRSSRP